MKWRSLFYLLRRTALLNEVEELILLAQEEAFLNQVEELIWLAQENAPLNEAEELDRSRSSSLLEIGFCIFVIPPPVPHKAPMVG